MSTPASTSHPAIRDDEHAEDIDLSTGTPLRAPLVAVLQSHDHQEGSYGTESAVVAVSPSSSSLITVGHNVPARLWKEKGASLSMTSRSNVGATWESVILEGQIEHDASSHIRQACFANNGNYLITASEGSSFMTIHEARSDDGKVSFEKLDKVYSGFDKVDFIRSSAEGTHFVIGSHHRADICKIDRKGIVHRVSWIRSEDLLSKEASSAHASVGGIHFVAIAPQFVALGCEIMTNEVKISVFDVLSAKALFHVFWVRVKAPQLRIHQQEKTSQFCMAFSNDGSLLAAARGDIAQIFVTDPTLGQREKKSKRANRGKERHDLEDDYDRCIAELELKDGSFTSLAFFPDANNLATGTDDHRVLLWSLHSQNVLVSLPQPGTASSIWISPCGTRIIGGSEDGTVHVYNRNVGPSVALFGIDQSHQVRRREQIAINHIANISSMTHCSTPTGDLMVVASAEDNSLSIFRGDRLTSVLQATEDQEESPPATTPSPSATTAVAAMRATMVSSNRPAVRASSLSVSPNGSKVAMSSQGETINLWDITSEPPKRLEPIQQDSVTFRFVAFDPHSHDGTILLSNGPNGIAKIWNVETRESVHELEGHQGAICTGVFHPTRSKILATGGSTDKSARVWSVQNSNAGDSSEGEEATAVYTCIATLDLHDGAVRSIAFSPVGPHLVTGSDDKSARVWNFESGECISVLKGHTDCVTCVTFLPEGDKLATGSKDCALRIWEHDIAQKQYREVVVLESHRHPIHFLAISGDGQEIVSSSSYEICRWNVPTLVTSSFERLGGCLPLPPSSLTINDRFFADLMQAEKSGKRFDWPRFRAADKTMLRLALSSHYLVNRSASNISTEERNMLLCPDLATCDHPLHVAVRCGSAAASFLRRMLDIAPFEAVTAKVVLHGETDEWTLLRHALECDSGAHVSAILDAFVKLLTVPPEEDANDAKDKTRMFHVFRGNDLQPQGAKRGPHVADYINVKELCEVAKGFPRLFSGFVRRLALVPQYSVTAEGLPRAIMVRSDHMVVGSYERTPYIGTASFWKRHVGKTIPKLPSVHPEDVSVKPALLPLKSIAALQSSGDGRRPESLFLKTVYDVRTVEMFESEVVRILVDFKWDAFAKWMFFADAIIFLSFLLCSVVLFPQYSLSTSSFVSWPVDERIYLGILCLATVYFAVMELIAVSRRGLVTHYSDGWSILELVLLALTITRLSFIGAVGSDAGRALTKIWEVVEVFSFITYALKFLFFLQGGKKSGALVRGLLYMVKGIRTPFIMLFLFVVTFGSCLKVLFRDNTKFQSGLTMSEWEDIGRQCDSSNSSTNDQQKEWECNFAEDVIAEYNFLDKYAPRQTFFSYGRALQTVFAMTFGNVDPDLVLRASLPELANSLVILGVLVTGVILLNVFIAMISDLYDQVQEQGEAVGTAARAYLVLRYEDRLLSFSVGLNVRDKLFPRWIQVLQKDKSGDSIVDNNDDDDDDDKDEEASNMLLEAADWKGRVNAIKKAVVKSQEPWRKKLSSKLDKRIGNLETKLDAILALLAKQQQEQQRLAQEGAGSSNFSDE